MNLVQGPFKLDDKNSVYIKKESDINYPLGLYLERNNISEKIDFYEMNGDTPSIYTVFFLKLHKVKNVIVLVSWSQDHRAENISGRSYQIYAYEYKNEKLIPNNTITSDPNLNGEDGEFSGETLHFKYQNSESIKQYLMAKYNQ
jgi:hypothetical protein